MLFDIAHIPFSRRGRFLTLSMMAVPGGNGEQALYLRFVAGGDERPSLGRLCRMDFLDTSDNVTKPAFELAPERLVARGNGSEVEFVIGHGEQLHIRGAGCGVRFHLEGSRYDYVYRTPKGEPCLVAAVENVKFIPRADLGALDVTGSWQRDHSEKVSFTFSGEAAFEGSVDFFRTVPPEERPGTFDEASAGAQTDFAAWHRRMPAGILGQEEAHRLASYLLWANTVPAGGALTRPAIYMSKNHMINLWSWDNAFSALGVVGVDPALAFDQFAVIFDHQDASGLLPDYVNDRDVLFAFTKPPVHGWAVALIEAMQPGFLTAERKAYLKNAIGRQVDYWLRYARSSDDVLPCYFHGNDSGWDNSTFFAEGGPVMTPDLPVFLILACDVLATLLEDDQQRQQEWRAKAERLQALLFRDLWTGETFRARLTDDPGRELPDQNLIQFMPLLLGERLPRDMAQKLVARLVDGGFITEWGPATESPMSPLYEDDGYWRGPIWAPTTMLLWDGLQKQGELELSRSISEKFCSVALRSGMAENFAAVSGMGLRDRAFAWTSAVYILLAASLSKMKS
ncbi:amylo-alpha-1,6-glucosidase [Rhizobium lusitanum]|uniref:Glycogen debranching enzyme n=2 Tax=Rhizobium lusitanum TaxID=293958 RepID=A0A7X0MEF4_9HYPH|nr:glycoside hydrolase family 37 [Rhizobium lusitanum]MBB6485948.1 glycogen debranching enzyme [Rhizobium lusitanum]